MLLKTPPLLQGHINDECSLLRSINNFGKATTFFISTLKKTPGRKIKKSRIIAGNHKNRLSKKIFYRIIIVSKHLKLRDYPSKQH